MDGVAEMDNVSEFAINVNTDIKDIYGYANTNSNTKVNTNSNTNTWFQGGQYSSPVNTDGWGGSCHAWGSAMFINREFAKSKVCKN